MSNPKNWSGRIDSLIELANQTLATSSDIGYGISVVNPEKHMQLRSSSLSLIENIYGTGHSFYKEFDKTTKEARPSDVRHGIGILNSIKSEFDGGWNASYKGIISAEIFSDFLEMAEHLLSEGYKDAAAVMTGSVLEEHLRQLCTKNEIDILQEDTKTGKLFPKKMQILNQELVKKAVYNELIKKSVDVWFELRNKAAHGEYNEYSSEQVIQMLQSVTNFIGQYTV